MSDAGAERLYNLLPVLYRQRDLAEGQPLRALLAVLEKEYDQVQRDVGAIYDDWFVETCDNWVLPYLAELLGVDHLSEEEELIGRQRRRVANTLGYRRRKGTTAALEHVLHDVAGWPVYAAELFRYLSVSQHLSHARPESGRLANLRRPMDLAQVNGPFDTLAHTPDLRRDSLVDGRSWPEEVSANGRHNLRRLALHVWRLNSYPLERAPARLKETAVVAGRQVAFFTFDILGRDTPHFHRPQPVQDISDRPEPQDLPIRLTREMLSADLRAFRSQDLARVSEDRRSNTLFYGPARPLHAIYRGRLLGPKHVVAGSLNPWPAAEIALRFVDQLPVDDGDQPYRAIIDPEAGRLALILPAEEQRQARTGELLVSYAYGFADNVGAGPYERYRSLRDISSAEFQVDVFKAAASGTMKDGHYQARSLQEALRYWQEYCEVLNDAIQPGTEKQARGVIRILDNGAYGDVVRPLNVHLGPGAQLTIIAGDGMRPLIRARRSLNVPPPPHPGPADIFSYGISVAEDREIGRRLRLSGLLIEGPVTIQPIRDGTLSLEIESCTLLPDGIQVAPEAVKEAEDENGAPRISVHIVRSIVGPLRLPAAVCDQLHLELSIVDGAQTGQAILVEADPKNGRTPQIALEKATVFGRVKVPMLTSARAVIFNDALESDKPGNMAYCYQPPQTSRPVFTSTEYGQPGYAQLSHLCPPEIRSGAPGGAAIGVFHDLYELRREHNLQRMLDTYLPSGLTASIHYQS